MEIRARRAPCRAGCQAAAEPAGRPGGRRKTQPEPRAGGRDSGSCDASTGHAGDYVAGHWTAAAASPPATEHLVAYLVIAWSYTVAYLGLGRLVVALVRKFSEVTMFASVLLHALLLLAGSGIPTTIQWMSLALQNELYSYLQITNPIWTLAYLKNYGPTPEESVLAIAIPAAALCLFFLNLPGAASEMRRVRADLPNRVAEDEAELNPTIEPVGPWDEN